MKYFSIVVSVLFVIVSVTSCTSLKTYQYLQGTIDTARYSKVQIPNAVIQKGDLLSISVYSDDPSATAAVTRQSGGTSILPSTESVGSLSNASTGSGYLVDKKGTLQVYKIEPLYVEGFTVEQLADTLKYFYTKLDLLKNPVVEVRFLNYKITVLGEVTSPGPISVPTDKISAYEAIGLAGDINATGRRDNVLVVREVNGVRTFGRINLQEPNAFMSPYYYLKQNDLVIVDAAKNKVNNQSATVQYVSLGVSLLSITAVFISLFRK